MNQSFQSPVWDPLHSPPYEKASVPARRRSKRVPALAVGTAVLMLGAAAAAVWQQPWRDSPAEVVDGYMGVLVDSFENDEIEYFLLRARPYLCADSRAALDGRFAEHGAAGMDELLYETLNDLVYSLDYDVLETSIEGGSASVEVRLYGESAVRYGEPTIFENTLSIDLVDEDGAWRICDDGLPGT